VWTDLNRTWPSCHPGI